MSNLLAFGYWFQLQPEPLMNFSWNLLIGINIVLFILAVAFAVLKMRSGIWRGLYKRLYSFCLTAAIIGLFILFSNYEQIPFFMARFWIAIWVLIMAIWLFFILRDLRSIPQKIQELAEQKEKAKYLP